MKSSRSKDKCGINPMRYIYRWALVCIVGLDSEKVEIVVIRIIIQEDIHRVLIVQCKRKLDKDNGMKNKLK